LLVLISTYVSLLLIARWLSYLLFQGHERHVWQQPGLGETAYLVFTTCLPVWIWAMVLYLLARRFPRLLSSFLLAFGVLLVLIVVEIDLAWFKMADRHITAREAMLFLTDDAVRYWGLDPWQIHFFVWRISKHALVLASLWVIGALLRRRRLPPFLPRAAWPAGVLLTLFLADATIVGLAFSRERHQWVAISIQNPFRLSIVDRVLAQYLRGNRSDLAAANDALDALRGDTGPIAILRHGERTGSVAAPANPSVLLVTVEGLNTSQLDSLTGPFWTEFARRSTELKNHYSTGNVTVYGILGLLHGSPPAFYREARTSRWSISRPVQGSPYIDAFNRHGFETKVVSWEIEDWNTLGRYFFNFQRSSFGRKAGSLTPADDWAMIPRLLEELNQAKRQFVQIHYWSTHFPYAHSQRFARFAPEVPEGFDYDTADRSYHRQAIVNRYRNCLLEFDEWLRTLIAGLDLARTIVVVTGDHGEELFEQGRLTHTTALNDAQTKTPALLYIPGVPGRVFDEVTSHTDIMPTLADILGWGGEVQSFGRSIYSQVLAPSAVVATSNRPYGPEKWAVVTANGKSIVAGPPGGRLQIVDLVDRADRRVSFDPATTNWKPNFTEVIRLETLLRTDR